MLGNEYFGYLSLDCEYVASALRKCEENCTIAGKHSTGDGVPLEIVECDLLALGR